MSAQVAKRGRPRAAIFSADDVAELLGCPVARVLAALESPGLRAAAFPSAFFLRGSWGIPEREVVKLLGPGVPQLFSVADFARLIGFSESHVYAMISDGVIEARKLLGLTRISADQYWSIPAERPACTAPRPTFFSAVNGGAEK